MDENIDLYEGTGRLIVLLIVLGLMDITFCVGLLVGYLIWG